MWYNKFNWTILAFVVLFTLVTGSCLEYGHSCWGAHGKRSGIRAAVPVKQATPYNDNLTDQLLSNNNANFMEDDSNNNNKLTELPLTAGSALSPPRGVEGESNNEGKWRKILRQHRYQLRQLQRQFDATDAADSWRRLQQAMEEAEQQQRDDQQQQQQQQLPIGDFFVLQK